MGPVSVGVSRAVGMRKWMQVCVCSSRDRDKHAAQPTHSTAADQHSPVLPARGSTVAVLETQAGRDTLNTKSPFRPRAPAPREGGELLWLTLGSLFPAHPLAALTCTLAPGPSHSELRPDPRGSWGTRVTFALLTSRSKKWAPHSTRGDSHCTLSIYMNQLC